MGIAPLLVWDEGGPDRAAARLGTREAPIALLGGTAAARATHLTSLSTSPSRHPGGIVELDMIRAALLARMVDASHVPIEVTDPQLCRLARLAHLLRATAPTSPPTMPAGPRGVLRRRLRDLSPR